MNKREFKFEHLGTREDGTHQGKVSNLQMLKSQETGSTRLLIGSTMHNLWAAVHTHIKNYRGGLDATVLINGVVHEIPGGGE